MQERAVIPWTEALNLHYTIRKATIDDCDPIHAIIEHYAEEKLILTRSHDEIASTIDTFYVAVLDDESIIGTVSFYNYGNGLNEVRSLGVRKEFLRKGIGSALLKRLMARIAEEAQDRLFVLSYAPVFFQKNGFTVVDRDELPEKIWKDCNSCANKDNCSEIALIINVRRP